MADQQQKPASTTSTEDGKRVPAPEQNQTEADKRFNIEIPGISLPKGGGAIKGIDEKFEVNAVNGTANFSIPIPAGSARGFGAALSLSYNSGSGNGIFGLGWSLSLSSIRRKTEKELPRYFDATDSDTYIFSGAEDLVPVLKPVSGNWGIVEKDSPDGQYRIRQYRPRIEGAFARIERWTKKSDGIIHWHTISRDNITSIYGDTDTSKIADPSSPKKIFEWLLRFSYDDKGNCCLYEYKKEDAFGQPQLLHNKNRINGNAPFTNTYLKRVRCGNIHPYTPGNAAPAANDFLFETVFDYGEHDANVLPFNEINPWSFREDAFSAYHAGFEIRTCRLCSRILMYHHFAELPGGSALVNALRFNYDNNDQQGNFTFLKEIYFTGYTKQDNNSYSQKTLPPFSFDYSKHAWNKEIKSLAAESIADMPVGIYEPGYQWVDLYSEGLSGILTEQASYLLYKQNYGNGDFSPAKAVAQKPSFSGLQLTELEADGIKYLASYEGWNKGFFKINDDEEWQTYKTFEQLPNVSMTDPDTRMIDLNGDGRAEILISGDNVFTWYPSLGEKGFGIAENVWKDMDEEKGPRIVFNDKEQSIYLSDMNGDGLTDIVRIENGSVCYWPNLGYGRFGAKVEMDNAPVFDHPDLFNPSYIKLSDIDGSGTIDILYNSPQQCRIWLNQSGNSFLAQPEIITTFPDISQLSQISLIDLLGNGTSCITWSSSSPKDQRQPLKYIDLMDSRKPHLMMGYRNNMGKEVEFEYKPSTHYYLQDRLNGNPWVTKLPFPVHCLSKVISYDRIMKTRFASEYSYHHGYYDHAEREFRGFGRVEQRDAEDIAHFIKQNNGNVLEEDLHQPPVLMKTWFHTGAYINREKIINQFAHEYSQNQVHTENLLPEPELPAGLTVDELREALRACKGTMLRKETYALDNSLQSDKPYIVEQQNSLIRLVQPRGNNKYASFLPLNSESITYHYERDLSDPRISHGFLLEVDGFGNVEKSASLVYKRINPAFPEQDRVYVTYTENNYSNSINTDESYRLPSLYETIVYEVTGMSPASGYYYSLEEIKTTCTSASIIDYDITANGSLQKRLIKQSRMQFRGDNGVTVLPLGTMQSKGLVHQTCKAAFNVSQLTNVFSEKIAMPDLNTVLLDAGKGAYIFTDNYYWIPSCIPEYDTENFFLSISFTDFFGQVTQVNYDNNYHLFIESTTNPLGNQVTVMKFNYRVMKPYVVRDINDNLSAVRFDDTGVAVKSFSIGKKGIDAGDEFDDSSVEMSVNDFPSSEIEYFVFEWFNQTADPLFNINQYKARPNYMRTKGRDTHYHADPAHATKWQETYAYFNGGGQVILNKAQAEPGAALQVNDDGSVTNINTSPAVRWVGNGRAVLNNKGNPVKQYEAYFSVKPSFDDEKEMVELGVTPVMHYDPIGRTIRIDYPDKTFSRFEFSSWRKLHYDANDTVRDSQWYIDRGSPDPLAAEPNDPDQRSAWLAAKHHNTPSLTHFDTLGRTFLAISDNVTETIEARTVYDIEGNVLQISDGLNRVVSTFVYGLGAIKFRQTNIDSGNRWSINDAAGMQLLAWDDRNNGLIFEYDALRRLVSSFVNENGTASLFNKTEYGESLPVATAKANNLLGIAYKSFDQVGITINEQRDFKGNLLRGTKQFASDYKNKIDWTNPSDIALESEIFENSAAYDAFNRAIKLVTPHSPAMPPSEIYPSYNEANLLDKLEIFVRGSLDKTTFVTNINYDAKGQREEILYGNGTRTKYTYEKETLRMINLVTTRNPGAIVLQNLTYTFDPAGNITELKDSAHPDIFFDGEMSQSLNKYEYDAIYRLLGATGRKHAGQTDTASGIDQNDANAFRNYREKYTYDKAGNMLGQQHISKNSSWTRTFEYDNGNNLNNRLTSTTIGADVYNYTYDPHGNMLGLETINGEVWDFLDHFKEANLGGGGTVYYVNDSSGQRARKIIERADGTIKERIYLGSVEIYRERSSQGTTLLERETLHVMDKGQRIAMIDTPVIKPVGNSETQLIRYQYSNHLNCGSLELDETAQMISYEEYFPFGTSSYVIVDTAREVPARRYRYTGKERDEETGLNYHGARYYALWLCRWTAADPSGIDNGTNLYVYVKNNPVIHTDPDGKQEKGKKDPWKRGIDGTDLLIAAIVVDMARQWDPTITMDSVLGFPPGTGLDITFENMEKSKAAYKQQMKEKERIEKLKAERPAYREKPVGYYLMRPFMPGVMPPDLNPELPVGLQQLQAGVEDEVIAKSAQLSYRTTGIISGTVAGITLLPSLVVGGIELAPLGIPEGGALLTSKTAAVGGTAIALQTSGALDNVEQEAAAFLPTFEAEAPAFEAQGANFINRFSTTAPRLADVINKTQALNPAETEARTVALEELFETGSPQKAGIAFHDTLEAAPRGVDLNKFGGALQIELKTHYGLVFEQAQLNSASEQSIGYSLKYQADTGLVPIRMVVHFFLSPTQPEGLKIVTH